MVDPDLARRVRGVCRVRIPGGVSSCVRRATKRGALERLKRAGFKPGTVFDVGVYHGTPELYDAFPAARHVLVEPVREHEPFITAALSGIRDGRIEWVAASDREGREILSVSANLQHSRAGRHTDPPWNPRLERVVDLARLDALRRPEDPAPLLIKVDVDGPDLEVLEGASGILPETHVIIVEATLTQIARRVNRLEELGFTLWDAVDLCYGDSTLYQADLVFVQNRLLLEERFCPWVDGGLRGPLETEL